MRTSLRKSTSDATVDRVARSRSRSFDGTEKTGRSLNLVQRHAVVSVEQAIRIVIRGIQRIEIVERRESAGSGCEALGERGLPGLAGACHYHDRHHIEICMKPQLKCARERITHDSNDNHSLHE